MLNRKTLMRAMAKVRRAWNNHVRQIVLSEGVPDSYRTVLMYLLRHPGASQRDIAEFACITTSAVNQVVKSMLEEDYLYKETDPSDRRNSRLYLTDKGSAVAVRIYDRLGASDDAITARITPEKEAELISLLEEITEFIQKDLI